MKRLKYISMMLLLVAALQAAGQSYVIENVCLGSERKYRIEGEAGSTYEWLLIRVSFGQVALNNSSGIPFTKIDTDGKTIHGNEITIEWKQVGVYKLEAVQYSLLGCDTLEQGIVEVFEQPLAIAGNPLSICAATKVNLTSAAATNYSSVLWTTSGDGFFDDPFAVNTAYNIGSNDRITGNVKLTLTAQGKGNAATCNSPSSTLTATFKSIPKLVIHNPAVVCPPLTVDLSDASVTAGSEPFLIFEYFTDKFATNKLAGYQAVSSEGTYYIKATNINDCSVLDSVKVTFNKLFVPSFAAIPELCLNSVPPPLPPSSFNGIAGKWLPATISTSILGETLYKFTPDAGQCAKDTTFKIVVTNSIIPLFSIDNSFCLGSDPQPLPDVSKNGIIGTWNPKTIITNSMGTYTYTFTPDPSQCGELFKKDITITLPGSPPTFHFDEICLNSNPPPLPTVSVDGYSGTWSPAAILTDQAGRKNYTFTPSPGQCVQQRVEAIEVVNKKVPDFDPIGPLCLGSASVTWPTTSKNGITGTWTPSAISTVTSGKATYTFTPDAGLCAENFLMEIQIYERITVAIKADPLLVLGGTTKVTISATGGSGNYVSGVGIFDSGAGTPTFTVVDDAGCSGSASIYISNPQDFNVLAVLVSPIKCLTGYATITAKVTGGTAPYIYTLTGGSPPYNSSGNDSTYLVGSSTVPYQFTVRDKNGLSSQSNLILVSDPPVISLTTSFTSPICVGGANGTATVIANAGVPPYFYQWNDPLKQTTAKASGLPAGKYTVEVTDINACQAVKAEVTVTDPPAITLTAKGIDPSCPGADGNIQLTFANIPDGNYDILYDGGKFGAVGIAGNKATVAAKAGTYKNLKLFVNTCSSADGVNITLTDPAKQIISEFKIQPSCKSPTGTIAVTVPQQGTGFEYSINNGAYQTLATFPGLNPGSHQLKVRKIGAGCEAEKTITINQAPQSPASPTVSITTHPNCTSPVGTIQVSSPLGNNYQYSLDEGIYQTSAIFANLPAGSSHTIKTKDLISGCESLESNVTIEQVPGLPAAPQALVAIHPTCNNPDGTVQVSSPNEGTGYEYSIDGAAYQQSASFTGLLWGDHSIRVINTITGCESSSTKVTVNAIPPAPELKLISQENAVCFGGSGSISLAVTNTIDGVYTLKYDGGQFSNVSVTKGIAKIIVPAGTYNNLTIDANGCTSSLGLNVTVTQPGQIIISESITEIDLKTQRQGAIDLTVSGGAGSYSYIWSNGEITEDIKNLTDGTYSVVVTDINGCQQEKIIRIPVPNRAPVAMDDVYSAGCGTTGNLLVNDFDLDKDTFFIDQIPIESPVHGTLTVNEDGSFVYVSAPGYTGDDVFRYAIYDANHYLGDTAKVTITVMADFDCDGVPDNLDPDADGDGILNVNEGSITLDSDGDGHPNWLDIDADNDGIPDNFEAQGVVTYIPPKNRDADGDGLDDAYDTDQGGTLIVPIDTDGDWVPDFLDADSDDDLVPDYIEGHDPNAVGKPDHVLTGKDLDSDGLDDGFDTVNRFTTSGNATGSNAAMQDFDRDGARDWRDNNDDNDEYLTRFEDLNADGDFSNDDLDYDGHPEYLEYGRGCDLFIPDAFSPNNDNIHEYFQIYCIDQFPKAKMYIFDQLGNKVFEKANYGNLDFWGSAERAWWNGKTENRSIAVDRGMVPPGTYYYVLQLGNGEVKKSFVFVSY